MDRLRTIEPEDLFRLRLLQSVQLSPDGKQVAYTVVSVDTDKDQEHAAVWLQSLETGAKRQLTVGAARDFGAQWSPDGRRIAFISSRGGAPQVYVIPVDGGEARALTAVKRGVSGGPLWSPDGTQIAFASAANEATDRSKPFRVTRFIYRSDGMGYVDDAIKDVFVVPSDGGEPRRLTDAPYLKSLIAWSPDGQELLFSASLFPESADFSPRLCTVDLNGETRELIDVWGWSIQAAWTLDGTRIAYLGGKAGAPDGCKNDLWVIDRRGGKPECRTSGQKLGVGGGFSSDVSGPGGKSILMERDGRTATVDVQNGGTAHLLRIALSGPESCVPVQAGHPSCFLIDGDERHLLYAVSDFDRPAELFISDADGAGECQLTHLNDDLLSARRMASVEHLLFHGSDGEPVEGWILKPPIGRPPYPTILYSHPGPHNAFGRLFNFEFQMLAGAGYAVLVVNFRGSKGYGTAFGTRTNGDWGNLDYGDSMAGVEYVIARGIADPERLGCCGMSFGGYLTCWIVGHTGRFKAAVAENPLTSLLSAYGTTDIGPGPSAKEHGGKPHEIPEVYRRCSPITYAHQCGTPTLLVQAEADYRCIAEQSEQFYTVLKANGCTVEMLRLPNVPHVGSKSGPLAVRRAQNAALLDWMNRYVLGREPTEG